MPKGVYDRKPIGDRIKENITICPEKGCWLWNLRLDKDGYGQISVNCKTKHAHRVAYEALKGPIGEGMVCSHLCDEKYPADSKEYRRCCNPEHISVVPPAENSNRMKELGRSKPSAGTYKKGDCVGSKNSNSKLTEAQVREILEKVKKGLPYGGLKALASEYPVSYITIQKIVSGETWTTLYNEVIGTKN